MPSSPRYSRLKAGAKLLLGLAIIAYLIYQAQSHNKFDELINNPKDWGDLALSLGCVVSAVLLGFLRWYLLVRAVDLPFTAGDAFRLGSLGFALNFVGPGGVGGDLYKGVALAREHPDQKSEAIATVVADRLVGLTSLLTVTSTAIIATGMLWDSGVLAAVRALAGLTVVTLVLVLVLGSIFMAPGKVSETTARLLGRAPLVGKPVANMFVTCQVMSRHPHSIVPAFAVGVLVHLLLVLSFHLVAAGLPLEHPPLSEHFCIVPLAETAGAIPLTPGGLGTTEAALSGLYASVGFDANSGAIVALGQRLMMLTTGVLATVYYLTQRRSLQADEARALDPK